MRAGVTALALFVVTATLAVLLAVLFHLKKLHGAAAALAPAGTGMGQIAGYTVADYLIQYTSRERRYARVPASTWDALLSHIRDPDDATRLAASAQGRLLYCYAIPLYRHAADGDEEAASLLADLLARRGDQDGAMQMRIHLGSARRHTLYRGRCGRVVCALFPKPGNGRPLALNVALRTTNDVIWRRGASNAPSTGGFV